MRYELADYEWIAIKPMLPNKAAWRSSSHGFRFWDLHDEIQRHLKRLGREVRHHAESDVFVTGRVVAATDQSVTAKIRVTRHRRHRRS